jgi:hypothetical protein
VSWQMLAKQLLGTQFASLTAFMDDAADGGFVWGSIGDVVQYRAFAQIRANVITHVAAQIATVVQQYGAQQNYSVLAHSLGTAVATDSIRALATRDVVGNTVLQPPTFMFSNFFALANVSRLVWATDGAFYQETPVRPFDSGLANDLCTVNYYASFRHVADPVSSIVRFSPKNWNLGRYGSHELRHYRDLNVHAFLHYLQAPQVSDRILARLFPVAVTPAQRAARFAAYPDYLEPDKEAKKLAVDDVAVLLDDVNGQAHGKLELDASAIAKAIWHSRARLEQLLAAHV